MILVIALGLRVLWAGLIHVDAVSDAKAYQLLAHQLAAGGVYGFGGGPYTYWPVGYPFFLSLQLRLFGELGSGSTGVSIALSAATVGLTMLLAWRWFQDRRIAVTSGVLMAAYPAHVQFVTITSSECLFTVLLISAVLLWGSIRRGDAHRAVLAGVCLGLAAYVRPLALAVPLPLSLARWSAGWRLRDVCLWAFVVMATALLTIAPWTYRNYLVYGRFVPVSTNGGVCLFFGNNPLVPDAYQSITMPADFVGDDAQRDAYCAARAFEYIRAAPWAFAKRTLRKTARMWERDTIGVVWNAAGIERRFGPSGVLVLKVGSQLCWVAFLVLCALAVMRLPTWLGWRALLGNEGIWITLGFTAVYAVTFSQDRYHYPLVPLLVPLAAAPLARIAARRRPA